MNNYSCTIWQLLMLGCTWLCGGISLGVTIGRDSRQREIDELRDRLLLKGSDSSVTPQPKSGKWIRVDDTKLRCSECDVIHFIAMYPSGEINFCPNCGADMREGEE